MVVFNTGRDFPLLLLSFIFCLRWTAAAFVSAEGCNLISDNFGLEHFIVDAALDTKDKKLKFFMNSKIIQGLNDYEWPSTSPSPTIVPDGHSEIPAITDVNITTNTFTTFHFEVDFMGKTFIRKNLRLCDMVMVKNDTAFRNSPRFVTPQSPGFPSATHIPAPERLNNSRAGSNREAVKRPLKGTEISNNSTNPNRGGLAMSNATIEGLFNNATGALVQCPLYVNDSIALYFEADVSEHFNKLGSYLVRFSIIPNDLFSFTVGCSRIYVTPVQSKAVSQSIRIGVILLLVVTAIVNLFTIVYSSYQESSNPFLFTASTICNEDLLKQLDATVPRIIIYLQFALFSGSLDLLYPGFFQPFIAQFRWCALLGYPIINKQGYRSVELDNIYRTLNTGGLKSLFVYFNNEMSLLLNWPNFMLCLLIWILVLIFLQQLFLLIKHIVDRIRKGKDKASTFVFSRLKNLCLIVGQILNNFFVLFAVPFVVLTVYMFSNADKYNGHHKYVPDLGVLRYKAFSQNSSYDSLLAPSVFILYNNLNNKNLTTASNNGTHLPTALLNNLKNNSTLPEGIMVRFTRIPATNVVLGAVLVTVWVALAFYFTINYLITIKNKRLSTSPRIAKLYTSIKTILFWGFLYHQYHPQRVLYIIYYLLNVLAKLLIIGCLQLNGLVQVTCLIIIEFSDITTILMVRPYYVPLSWRSSIWMLPLARVAVTFLCIPYIRELDFKESTREYVAYTQLLIHLVVAIVFIIQLVYCFVITLASIVKTHRERKQYAKYSNKLGNVHSPDDFVKQFEYQPVGYVATRKRISTESGLAESLLDTPNVEIDLDDDDYVEDLYYRAKSERQLKKVDSPKNAMVKESENDVQSYKEQEEFSNVRKSKNDYRVREGDRIYNKYFIDEAIDPEVKELWDSRSNWDSTRKSRNSYTSQPPQTSQEGILGRFTSLWREKAPVEAPQKGFQVLRPRPLVVRPLPVAQSSFSSGSPPSLASSKGRDSHEPVEDDTLSIDSRTSESQWKDRMVQ